MKKSDLQKDDLRRLAEEKIRRRDDTTQPLKKADALRLIHELQVHLIELELQNEELLRTRAEAEESYRLYTDLYDFAPLGYFTLTQDGTIRRVNLAGANLLGMEPVTLIGRRLGLFIAADSLPVYNDFLKKLLSCDEKETCEVVFQKKNGELVWARVEATCFNGGQECRVVLMDITSRKRMSSLLQARVRISEFADTHTLDELLQKALDEAEALTGSQIGFAHFLEADQKTLHLQMWSTNTIKNMCSAEGKGEHYPVEQAGVWADCVSTRAPLIHNDYASLAHRKGLPQGHAPIQRELVVPVLRNDLIVMIMGVGNKSTDYDDNDVGTLSQLAKSTWDIIQRKQAEEALKESEWRNRVVSELITDYIFIVDVDPTGILKLRWASDNLFRLTGRKIDDVATSDAWADIVHPYDRPRFLGFIKHTLLSAETGEFECRTFSKQGMERWVRVFVRPQGNDEKKVTTIIGAVQDITKRKQAEEALQDSEERFRSLIEQSTDGIILINEHGNIIEWNTAETHITGIPKDRALGMPFWEIQYQVIRPERRAIITPEYLKEIFLESLQTGLADQLGKPLDVEIVSVDGELKFVQQTSFIIRAEKGNRVAAIVRDITENKRAEDALRDSQETFALFMSHSPIYAFIKEVTPDESRVLQASDNYMEMIGVTGQEMIGKTMQDIFPPESAAKFTADDWAVVSSGGTLKLDENLNGRFYNTIKFPLLRGDKTLLAGYTIDITERVQAQAALQESELFVKSILNSLTEHIAVLDEQGVIVAVNDAWRNFARENGSRDADDFVGVNYLTACESAIRLGDPIASQVDQGIRAVLGGAQSRFGMEYPCHSPWKQRWFTVTLLPLTTPTRGLVVIHQDITERKQAEQALRISEEKYRTVANFTYDWETWRGPDGVYRYVSPSCERVTGHTVDEFLADPDLLMKITHPDDQPQVAKHYTAASQRSRGANLHLDFRIFKPDGEIRWIGHYCTAVYGEDGQWLGRRESNRDITERRQMEEALEAVNLQLQTAFAREQQLARTDPLTGINNRRHLYDVAEHEIEVAARYQHPLSVIMFDIDHFKKINDVYGHMIGDQFLERVTQVACVELRAADVIGRYGGEEFIVLMPMTNAEQAFPLAERIRMEVEAMRVPTPQGEASVTLSIGIVELRHKPASETVEHVFRRADKTMYSAKQAGRNRTKIGK